ncbi:MAG: ABC transporter substrate-binding protein [Chloroflexi bacterium]|nr:ABC transporter substrate-binding protein [Chloroflexota bacterium]
MKKKLWFLLGWLVVASMLITACQPETIIQTVVVTEMVEGTPVEVVITATPAPEEAEEVVSYDQAPDPTTMTYVMPDDAACLDPHLAYEGTSYEIISNVLEGLIFFNRQKSSEYIPQLSTNVPTVENGGLSADGLTYTFNIRPGVKYENGNDLTASDAAYSFERVLLQSDPNSGAWMMIEAIMGYSSGDITEKIAEGAYAGDQGALMANATAEELVGVCEEVKSHFTADDATGVFTVTLPQPWGPFLPIIARPWAYILDKEWSVEQGDWDGSCDTWQNFYAPGQEATKLAKVIMGTGPYKLESWTPDVEWILTAKEDYWRQADDPQYEGGPGGPARIKRIVHKTVAEWGTRFAMLQTGDAAMVDVPLEQRSQVDAYVGEICDNETGECVPSDNPEGPLKMFGNLVNNARTDIFLNFNVKAPEGSTNSYIGSGKLDGNGIPPDFFSDLHMRKAISYCMDYDTYIAEGMNGDGVRNTSFLVKDILGYNPDQQMYPFDLDKCKEELDLAWDGKVAEVGFRVQGVTATGYTANQTALAILQSNLRSIDPKYNLEIVTLPWASYLASFRAAQLPIAVSGWSEDYHDPHNWAQPFLIGTYTGRANMPKEFTDIFRPLVEQAVAEPDEAKRAELYYQLGALRYEWVPEVTLAQAGSRTYLQRWVKDYVYNPVGGDYYYYNWSLAGGE